MSDTFNHEADAWDSLAFDDFTYANEPSGPRPALRTSCRYCGAKGLRWGIKGAHWRLFAGASVHTCAEYRRATAKRLEPIDETDRVRVNSRTTATHDVKPSSSTQQGNIMQVQESKITDKRAMLRVKVKSLGAEARIIRHEELRYRGTPLQPELWQHRVRDLRIEARATHLAYGFIRGRSFAQMEPRTRGDVSQHVKERVRTMLRKYGPTGMAEPDYCGK